jgi:NAD(P)-dependent dehydrogenase (short-subunit alcohol dehydrogenase family)
LVLFPHPRESSLDQLPQCLVSNTMSELRFDGRVAIITGAGNGLGRAYAIFLASRGASVVVNNRSEAAAHEVVRLITEAGGNAVADNHLVGTQESAERILKTTLDRFGKVDIVVNNAGYGHRDPFETAPSERFVDQLTVHAFGSLWLNRVVWPLMREARYGRIINTTSGTILGFPQASGYLTAKGAVIGLSRALAYEGEEFGIKSNCVSPLAQTKASSRPSGHPVYDRVWVDWKPESVAPLVAVLAHESCPVNGEVFTAGGGRVGRLFFGETLGYVDPDLSPESLLSNFDQVEDRTGYQVFRDAPDAVTKRRALVAEAHARKAR